MEQLTQPDLLQDIETEIQQKPATIGQRFINYLIDSILFYVFVIIAAFFVGIVIALRGGTVENMDVEGRNAGARLVLYLIAYLFYVILYSLFEGASKGKTLGKLLTRTRAIRADGSLLTWKDAFVRSLCRIIPFEPFSAFGGSPWHDSIANTMVVKERK
jgi:uncharacterized RDD family membrane protein YckC